MVTTKPVFKIIITSENATFRNILSSKYRLENFEVELAIGGFHLLHLLEKEKGAHLIICNGDMSDMSAYEMISLIRESKSKLELPIIFIEKAAQEKEICDLIDKGVIDFVAQSTNFTPILERTHKYFQQMKIIAA
jgi:response regulator RpfG family c-di-GMP phosphodiesterase